MKVQNYKNFKYNTLSINPDFTLDEFGNRMYTLEADKSLILEYDSCFVDCDDKTIITIENESLNTLLKNYENTVIELLHSKSLELFNNEFPIEKFQDTMKHIITDNIFVACMDKNTKVLSINGECSQIEKVYFKLDKLTFMPKEYFININILAIKYKEELEYEEQELEEKKEESGESKDSQETENNWKFF